MTKAIHLIFSKRRQSRDLARAYFRLARALRTGHTVPDPRHPDPSVVTLDQLRREFRLLAEPYQPPPEGKDDAEIPVEKLEGDTTEEADRQDRKAETEIKVALGSHGPVNLDKKLSQIDPDTPTKEAESLKDKAHSDAGARQAAAAGRIAMNAARDELASLSKKDKRVIGFVRISKTGHPCGWCAMLISRGLVFYRSAKSAQFAADGEKFHDNCYCVAVPVYSREEYATSDLYSQNREYAKAWPEVTKGYGGKAAVSVWRKYIKTQQRLQAGRATTQTTQEA